MENKNDLFQIVEQLSKGINPATGEPFPIECVYCDPPIVSALVDALKCMRRIHGLNERKKELPQKAGLRWTAEEDTKLLVAFDTGVPVKDLARDHNRTSGGIVARLMKFGRMDPSASIGQARIILPVRENA